MGRYLQTEILSRSTTYFERGVISSETIIQNIEQRFLTHNFTRYLGAH